MNKYFKEFLHRGLMFGGFGPIVAGIVFLVLSKTLNEFSLDASQVFMAIVSTYLLAFVQAGASVFNQIEEWTLTKSLFIHFAMLYIAYSLCYIVNSWIPFEWAVIAIFTAIFVVSYFIIWFTVYFIIKSTGKKLNSTLK